MKSLKSAKHICLIFILVLFSIILACDSKQKYPSLNVLNQYSGESITSVRLVGYDFENLLITSGNSQTFALDEGMPGGYTGINITVNYGAGATVSQKFNFTDGQTTTITLNGSNGEGSPYYNNTQLD